MNRILVVMALTLLPFTGHALDLAGTAQALKLADSTTPEYEAYRKQRAETAATYEEFLQWATPAEIREDLGITDDELVEYEDVNMTNAYVEVIVSLPKQRMSMTVGSQTVLSNRPIASARPGYVTTTGCHVVNSLKNLDKHHRSHTYHNAPMENSVFFYGGEALHEGSVEEKSHGCVHLTSEDSLLVFNTVRDAIKSGQSVRVCVTR